MNLTETSCTNVNVSQAFFLAYTGAGAVLTNCVFSNIGVVVSNECPGSDSIWTFANCSAQHVTNFGASSCVTINNGDFTAAGYNALGNGINNDQPAISNALQAAVNWCSNAGPATLYFHGGSDYFLNTQDNANDVLQVPPVTNLTLASDSATTPATCSISL
jgi:hypothetical protein